MYTFPKDYSFSPSTNRVRIMNDTRLILTVDGHKDGEKDYIIHTSTKVQYRNILLFMNISGTIKELEVSSHDTTQSQIRGRVLYGNGWIYKTFRISTPEPYTYFKLLKPIYLLSVQEIQSVMHTPFFLLKRVPQTNRRQPLFLS